MLSSTDKSCPWTMGISSLVLTGSHLNDRREGRSAAITEFQKELLVREGTHRTDRFGST